MVRADGQGRWSGPTATQGLSSFDLDLQQLMVKGVDVNGEAATFTRDGQELVITPATGIPEGSTFQVNVRYAGSPQTIIGSPIVFGSPYGFIHTDDGALFGEYLWGEHTGTRTAHQAFLNDYARPATSSFWRIVVADPQRDTMFSSAVYRRGGMTLQALREKLGDPTFFQILRTWVADHEYGNATTEEFIDLSEQVSGQDLTSFFDAWLYQPVKPTTW